MSEPSISRESEMHFENIRSCLSEASGSFLTNQEGFWVLLTNHLFTLSDFSLGEGASPTVQAHQYVDEPS